MDFDQDSQRKLLELLQIPEPDGQKLVMVLAAAMTLVLCWLTWQVRRELDPQPKDCDRPSLFAGCAQNLPPRDCRACRTKAPKPTRPAWRGSAPILAAAVTALCRQYSSLRYAAPSTARHARSVRGGGARIPAAALGEVALAQGSWQVPGRSSREIFARLQEFDFRPALLGQSQIHARRREIHQFVRRDRRRDCHRPWFAKLGQALFSSCSAHPARHGHVDRFKHALHAVFVLQAKCHDFELQLADGAENQIVVAQRLEQLRGALLAQLR